MFASARNKKNYHVMFPICRTVKHLQLMHFPCAVTRIIHTYFPLYMYWQCTSKDTARRGRGSDGSTTIFNTALVSEAFSDGSDTALSVTKTRDNSNATKKQYRASTENDDIVCFKISGRKSAVEAYQRTLPVFSSVPGELY